MGMLQYIPAKIPVFHDVGELCFHKVGVNGNVCTLNLIRCVVQNLFEESRHNGVQPAGTDVFNELVCLAGDFCDFSNAVIREVHSDSFRLDERSVLFD